jgi:ABC-type transport system involved in multi-copper enzyme maturation permease subunit
MGLSVVPSEGQFAARFLPWGVYCLILSLLFLMAIARQETDPYWRDLVVRIVGGVGAFLSVAGFLFSNIGEIKNVSTDFLLPYGFVMILLGLMFWWAFVAFTGVTSDLGYRAALGLGALGLLGFLVALGRSVLPPLFASWGWINPVQSYTMPDGLLLMGAGLLYVLFAVAMLSDNPLVVLTKRELATFFFSPLAYIVLFGFVVIACGLFWYFVYQTLWSIDPPPGDSPPIPQLEPIVQYYIIAWFPIICVIFVVPALTMRLLSEEHRTGTLEVMLTAPLGETTVVLSKFLAAFILFMVVWLPFGLNLVSLRGEGGQSFDYRPILSFIIALAFTGAGFASMGLFFSSLTRNQVAAAILTYVGMLLLTTIYFIKFLLPVDDWRRIVLTHISYIDLWMKSLEGKLAVRDLFYHLTAAVFWLFMSVKVLESRKWR